MRRPLARRRRRLARRRTEGLTRPGPFVVRVVNADSVSAGPRHVENATIRALTKAGRWGAPDLVLMQEMADVDAHKICEALDPGRWHVDQDVSVPGGPMSALAAIRVRSRTRSMSARLFQGSPRTSEGGGIRERPIQLGSIVAEPSSDGRWQFLYANGHAPPSRARVARALYLRRFKRVRAQVKVGDLNIVRRVTIALMPYRRVHSAGVLHVAVSRGIPSRAARIHVGTSHPAIDVVLWPSIT